jgi:hypothetical protein
MYTDAREQAARQYYRLLLYCIAVTVVQPVTTSDNIMY